MYSSIKNIVYKDGVVFLYVYGDGGSSDQDDAKTAEFIAMCLNQRERDNE